VRVIASHTREPLPLATRAERPTVVGPFAEVRMSRSTPVVRPCGLACTDATLRSEGASDEMFGITADDLDPLVDDHSGVATFFTDVDSPVTFV
jgi:hypothetical protein